VREDDGYAAGTISQRLVSQTAKQKTAMKAKCGMNNIGKIVITPGASKIGIRQIAPGKETNQPESYKNTLLDRKM
jgi:hypothetical protein